MNVAIGEAGQNESSSRVDYPRAHASPFFDGSIIADSNDFIAASGKGLGPGLPGVPRIDAAMNYHDGCRLGDQPLCACPRSTQQEECKHLARPTSEARFPSNQA